MNFEQHETGFLTQPKSTNGVGPFMVMNMRREMGGAYTEGNRARMFNTHMPTGDDADHYTGVGKEGDLGKVFIINKNMTTNTEER